MHKIRAILAFLFFIFYPYVLLSNEISKNNRAVKRGDIIVKIGDVPIYDFRDLQRALSGKYYGDKVNGLVVYVVKNNGRIQIYKRLVTLNIK